MAGVELGCGREFSQGILDTASIEIDPAEGRVHARGNWWRRRGDAEAIAVSYDRMVASHRSSSRSMELRLDRIRIRLVTVCAPSSPRLNCARDLNEKSAFGPAIWPPADGAASSASSRLGTRPATRRRGCFTAVSLCPCHQEPVPTTSWI